MRKAEKRQIGPRVRCETFDALERLAAANNCSVAYYVESVLEEHIARQRHPDAGGGVMQELVAEMDARFAKHAQRIETGISRELAATIVRLEKNLYGNFNGLKAMVDALARMLIPANHDAYTKAVRRLLHDMGISNGSPQ